MNDGEKKSIELDFRIREFAWLLLPTIQEYIATHQEEYQAFLRERAAKAETLRENGTERAAKSGEHE